MSHDYLPSWDYPVIELDDLHGLSPNDRERSRQIIDQSIAELGPAMGFDEGIEVFLVEYMGLTGKDECEATLGIFCSGTSSRPVMGVDLTALMATAKLCGVSWETELRVTLAHELAHAYQERLLEDDAQWGTEDAEVDAETFAQAWRITGVIDLAVLKGSRQPGPVPR